MTMKKRSKEDLKRLFKTIGLVHIRIRKKQTRIFSKGKDKSKSE
jgi:hypothetical protein